jgi:hypothetical protein
MADDPKPPAWGYSKTDPDGILFDDGVLPKGYFPNPAMVPGSAAEKQYRDDAARESAPVPWDAGASASAAKS